MHVGRTVVLLGVTSLLTDVSAEMVATVLPLYLLYTVGAPLPEGRCAPGRRALLRR
jgi:hypothetical protein